MRIFGTARQEGEDPRRELLDAIADVRRSIEAARNGFCNACEPELVDAAAFEIKALEARYSYLLRRAREEGCDGAVAAFKPLR